MAGTPVVQDSPAMGTRRPASAQELFQGRAIGAPVRGARTRPSAASIMKATCGWLLALAVASCTSGSHAKAPSESGTIATASPDHESASQVPECGPTPQSTGPLAGKIVANIEGPSSAPSGSVFNAHVEVKPASLSQSVFVNTESPAILFVLRGRSVVGRTLGPIGGVAVERGVTAANPLSIDAYITLSGCGPDSLNPANTSTSYGPPLPPGIYSVVAAINDDTNGEGSGKVFISAPFPLTVTPGPVPPSASQS